MKKIMFLMVFVTLLVLPMVSYADCASDCVNKCSPLGSGKEYATCLENCLKGCYDEPSVPDVPPPQPASRRKSDLNNLKTCAEVEANEEIDITDLVLAALSDNDLPCYAGGKYVGNCSRAEPYYNVFDGECYSTLNECKKADGDFANVPGYGGCVRCGR